MEVGFRRVTLALIAVGVVAAQACSSGSAGNAADEPAPAASAAATPSPDGAPEDPTGSSADDASSDVRARYAFVDVTRRTRSAELVPRDTWGALWADHDGDGDPDLFVGRHEWPPELFVNEGTAYSRARFDFVHPPGYDPMDDAPGVDRHSCAWGEANGDGLPDLYCAVGAERGTGVGPNQLFVTTDNGFRESASDVGASNEFGRSKSVSWLDHDGDGDLDLLVGNAQRLDRREPNVLFEHTEAGFVEADAGLEDELVTMSTSWSDWDADGDPDVLALQYPSSDQPAVAYENVGGSFREVTLPNVTGGPWHAASWGDFDADGRTDVALVAIDRLSILRNSRRGLEPAFDIALEKGQMGVWFDAENDGDLDLFVVQGAPPPMESFGANHADFLVVRDERRFRRLDLPGVQGSEDGCGDSAAAADYDRDGDVDLFVTNGAEGMCRGIDALLENRSTGGNWIAVDLVGPDANPWGFGARIRVRAGDRSYWRELTDGVNFRSQSEVAHQVFGIAGADAASVRVFWPDGTSDCVQVEAGSTTRVTLGSSPCPG